MEDSEKLGMFSPHKKRRPKAPLKSFASPYKGDQTLDIEVVLQPQLPHPPEGIVGEGVVVQIR